MAKELYDLNEAPPVGEVPAKMHAWLIRPERFGEPKKSFVHEEIETWKAGPGEVLLLNDTDCRGHLTQVQGDRPAVFFLVGFAEDAA